MSSEKVRKLLSLARHLAQHHDLWQHVARSLPGPQDQETYRMTNSAYDDSLRQKQAVDAELRALGCTDEVIGLLTEYVALVDGCQEATRLHGQVALLALDHFADQMNRLGDLRRRLLELGVDLTTSSAETPQCHCEEMIGLVPIFGEWRCPVHGTNLHINHFDF